MLNLPLTAGGDDGSSSSGWTDDGTVVRLTTITDRVGVGTASPYVGYKMHVVGDFMFAPASSSDDLAIRFNFDGHTGGAGWQTTMRPTVPTTAGQAGIDFAISGSDGAAGSGATAGGAGGSQFNFGGTGGAGTASAAAGAGGDIYYYAGFAGANNGGGGARGGDFYIDAGQGTGAGRHGDIKLGSSYTFRYMQLATDTVGQVIIGATAPMASEKFRVAGTSSPAANADGFVSHFGGTVVEAGSGTHAFVSSVEIDPPTITAGAASTTTAATLYITGAPTGGAANLALYVVGASQTQALTVLRTAGSAGSFFTVRTAGDGLLTCSEYQAVYNGIIGYTLALTHLRVDPNSSTGPIYLGYGRNAAGSFTTDTYSPTTAGDRAHWYHQVTYSPNAAGNAADFVAHLIQPTISGNTSGDFAGLVVAVNGSLTTGTAYLLDVGTTSSTWFSGFTRKFSVAHSGNVSITPSAQTSGTQVALTVTPPAHTGMTAGAEASDVYFNLARTAQFATGAITSQRAVRITAPTYAFVGASTITNAATLYIDAAPAAGANATITNAYSLWIDAGLPRIDSTSANNTVATVLGSVGPTGANTTVQEWLTIDINGTTRYIPCW